MMTNRKRLRPVPFPVWNIDIEKWTAKKVRENLWRFDPINDFADVMQEARILFWKLEKTYPSVIDAPLFFALYRTSLSRMFIDKARSRALKIQATACIHDLSEEAQPESNLQNYGLLGLIVEELPPELKTVLRVLTSGRVRLKLDKPTKKVRFRENHNMRLKRRYGLAGNPVSELKNHFNNS
jgi:hypothetical protein